MFNILVIEEDKYSTYIRNEKSSAQSYMKMDDLGMNDECCRYALRNGHLECLK